MAANIKVIPYQPSKHTILEQKWTTTESLDTLVEQWMASERTDGRLQIVGKERTIFSDTFDPVDESVDERPSNPTFSFNYPSSQYTLNGVAFDWYASTWFLLYNFYGWMVIPFHVYAPQLAAFIRDGKTSVHEVDPVAPFDKSLAKVTTEAASVEADVSILCENVLRCLHAFLTLHTYIPSIELRKATRQTTQMHTSGGQCVVHFDLSYPIWMLPSVQTELQTIGTNCPSHFPHHAGKLSIEMLSEIDINQPPPVAIPTATMVDEEFVRLRTRMDASGKFNPKYR